MSICTICGSSFYESGERTHMRCESCRENPNLASGVKRIMDESNYIQKKYGLDFNQSLEVIKLHYINDNLDSIIYAINHIHEM